MRRACGGQPEIDVNDPKRKSKEKVPLVRILRAENNAAVRSFRRQRVRHPHHPSRRDFCTAGGKQRYGTGDQPVEILAVLVLRELAREGIGSKLYTQAQAA